MLERVNPGRDQRLDRGEAPHGALPVDGGGGGRGTQVPSGVPPEPGYFGPGTRQTVKMGRCETFI